MLRVWHAKNFGRTNIFPADYEPVAEVNTTFPHDAFELTNHIHNDWKLNEGVTPVSWTVRRSTSVGDVIEDMDGGALLAVAGVGFNRMPPGAAVDHWGNIVEGTY